MLTKECHGNQYKRNTCVDILKTTLNKKNFTNIFLPINIADSRDAVHLLNPYTYI